MKVIEQISERHLGLPIGIGIVVAAVSAGPRLVKAVRPFAKGAIKGYFALQARAKESFAEMGEQMQDLVAEAKHEMEVQSSAVQEPAQEKQARPRAPRARKAKAAATASAQESEEP